MTQIYDFSSAILGTDSSDQSKKRPFGKRCVRNFLVGLLSPGIRTIYHFPSHIYDYIMSLVINSNFEILKFINFFKLWHKSHHKYLKSSNKPITEVNRP